MFTDLLVRVACISNTTLTTSDELPNVPSVSSHPDITDNIWYAYFFKTMIGNSAFRCNYNFVFFLFFIGYHFCRSFYLLIFMYQQNMFDVRIYL